MEITNKIDQRSEKKREEEEYKRDKKKLIYKNKDKNQQIRIENPNSGKYLQFPLFNCFNEVKLIEKKPQADKSKNLKRKGGAIER